MTPDITLGTQDTAPVVTDTLVGPDGNPFNLTGATVTMRYRLIDQTAPVVNSAAASSGDPTLGKVAWHPPPIAAGVYHANWVVILAGGDQVTVPNDRWLIMRVLGAP